MPRILIPTPLRQYAGNRQAVELSGGTVGELLGALAREHDELRRHLYTAEGKLRSFVNVYVNDEDIRHLEREATPVGEDDTVSIVPSIAGGAAAPAEVDGLSNEEVLRYSRHLIIPEIGVEGQLKLKHAKVLLIGAGGLGAPLGLYLAAAGVGRIGLVDFDVVDATNLQRQVIHSTADVGRKKLDSAIESMRAINPYITLDRFDTALTSANALDILRPYDIVVDGTDNFPTRYLVNDACVLLGKPNVYGSIFRFEGQASVFAYRGGPCYRCLYPEPPPPGLVPSCAEGGVLGILPGLIGLVQATEAVKLIVGIGEPLVGRLLLYDALALRFRELKLRRDPDCPVCGDHPTVRQPIDYQQFCGVVPAAQDGIDVTELKAKIDRGDRFLLLDVREPHEYRIARIPGSKLMPLGELSRSFGDLDASAEIVVHCKSGGRSAKAVELLKKAGFSKVANLKGGILAWSDKIDPSVPKY
jgi:molybdopterin/thiamine biosynthesis adenylyltransferase/rhodanese-related sulfurtransferase/molybdopterin converting factor small subunit